MPEELHGLMERHYAELKALVDASRPSGRDQTIRAACIRAIVHMHFGPHYEGTETDAFLDFTIDHVGGIFNADHHD